jgi:hypothetical protein
LTRKDLERERYEARIKQQRDERSRLEAAEAGGLTKGEMIGIIHICQRRLHRPVTPKEELLALPVEDLTRLAEQWEKELFSEPSSNVGNKP